MLFRSRCKREGRSEVILFNLCGHGHFDMSSYSNYMAGKLVDQPYDEAELAMARLDNAAHETAARILGDRRRRRRRGRTQK